MKFAFMTDDETEAIALVVSPICLLLLCNKYCLKKKAAVKEPPNKDFGETGAESDDEDWTGDRNCLCQRTCRRIDIKSEKMVTKERLLDELVTDLLKEHPAANQDPGKRS